jgi:prepilin-type N-terminal cleavage/methylation domain-containing protein
MRGFTIIELVIVFAIFALVASFGLPLGFDAYRNYLLTSEARNLLSILRRAENLALANNYSSDHGVFLGPNQFVIFQGSSYASRNPVFDENYPLNPSITVSSTPEVVFSRLAATTTATTITLSNNTKSITITINNQGSIDW